MATIYYSKYLGDSWGPWEGGHSKPPFPLEFDPNETTITMASRDGQDWCVAYDPTAGFLTWCTWDGDGWTDWHNQAELGPPPNWEINGEVSYFSAGARMGTDWLYSYNVEDGSVFCSGWADGEGYGPWEGPFYVEEDPPNIGDETDVFFAGDQENEWLISVNPEDWSVFFSAWNGEAYGAWTQAPDLLIPEEWIDMGLDIDGDARDGSFWVYATVLEDEDDYVEEEYVEVVEF